MINSIEDLKEHCLRFLVDSAHQYPDSYFKQFGDVDVHRKDDLFLFNYNHNAQFKNRWNWFELNARGLIINSHTGEIVARPFPKFFNYNERPIDILEIEQSGGYILEATEKMDGSLGILYRHNGEYKIATRGSFDGEQALWATEFLNVNYDLSTLPDNLTLLFEIIYPENRIVVNYGDFQGLALLGAIDRHYGRDLYFKEVELIAKEYGFVTPKVYTFDTLQKAVESTYAMSANEEGYVIRFSTGLRVKIKGEAYKHAHKFISNVTFDRVLDACAEGLYDKMIEGVPDEFLQEVKDHKALIDEYVRINIDKTEKLFAIAPKETRKEFALFVKDKCPDQMAYMFAKLDNREYVPLIYKTLKSVK